MAGNVVLHRPICNNDRMRSYDTRKGWNNLKNHVQQGNAKCNIPYSQQFPFRFATRNISIHSLGNEMPKKILLLDEPNCYFMGLRETMRDKMKVSFRSNATIEENGQNNIFMPTTSKSPTPISQFLNLQSRQSHALQDIILHRSKRHNVLATITAFI